MNSDCGRLTGNDRAVELGRIGDAQLVFALARDLGQIKMRIIRRAADAVVIGLRNLDRHFDGGHLFQNIVHHNVASALKRRVARDADGDVGKDLLPRQRAVGSDQRAPADHRRERGNGDEKRLTGHHPGDDPPQLAERAASLRLSCRPAVHHGRPSSFA